MLNVSTKFERFGPAGGHRHRRACTCSFAAGVVLFAMILGICVDAQAQAPARIDIARQSITQLPAGATSASMAIHGVWLGMPWSEARNVLDQGNIPYMFTKGTSPVVYVPPQNSTYYYVLNPSSYDVIEMGVIGTADLPLDNQFLFDAQRWKLTTARTQFFGNEGELITNEEGEAYNFPFLGFVLKYILPGSFRFVMVAPTNKPLTSLGSRQRGEGAAPQPAPAVAPAPAPAQDIQLDAWISDFQRARDQFEARKYTTALSGFRALSEKAPDPLLRIRSIYWMGESYYGLKQYRNARTMFQRVLAETDIAALRDPAQRMLQRISKRIR